MADALSFPLETAVVVWPNHYTDAPQALLLSMQEHPVSCISRDRDLQFGVGQRRPAGFIGSGEQTPFKMRLGPAGESGQPFAGTFAILLPMKKLNSIRIGRAIAGLLEAGRSRATIDEVGRAASIRHLDRILDRRKASSTAAPIHSISKGFEDFQLAEFKGASSDAA